MVISVTVPKGGAGKTTMSLNLGVWLARQLYTEGKKVCIVDANFQQADIGKLILNYRPNISELVRSLGDLTPQRISRHVLSDESIGCDFLLGPPTPEEANSAWITPDLYSRVIEALRPLYDYIIVDTPVAEPHHDLFSNFVLPQSDFIAIIANPNLTTIHNIYEWLRYVTTSTLEKGAGFDPDRVGIILNGAEDKINCTEEDVKNELAQWNFLGSIEYDPAWKKENNSGGIMAVRLSPEKSAAFARILYAITGEKILTKVTQDTVSGKKKKKKRGFFKRS